MFDHSAALELFARLESHHILLIFAILAAARALSAGITWAFGRLAAHAPDGWRMNLMQFMPLTRLLLAGSAAALIIRILVHPTGRNMVALIASGGLALAFALKDYGSSVMAGLIAVFERPYQPGDWISVEGTYGEVKAIGLRAVHIVTPDDTEVIIPHKKLWSASIHNATSGSRHLLCVAHFYLHPDHDGARVRTTLVEVASATPYLKADAKVAVVAAEKPWGTHYKLKAYANDSRDQFQFTTELTIRGKEALLAIGAKAAHATYAAAAS